MGIFRFMFKPMFDIRRWLSIGWILAAGRNIAATFRDLKNPPLHRQKETFEEAITRLNLTEKDLQRRIKMCKWSGIVYFVAGILMICYTLFLAWRGHFFGIVWGSLLSFLILAFAYRESVWYMMMKRRELKFSFKAWLHFYLRGSR